MFKSICLPKSNQLMVYIDNIQLIIGGGGGPKNISAKSEIRINIKAGNNINLY